MARLARYVIPEVPHHLIQRGNGRQQTFFGAADYAAYRDLLHSHCEAHGVGGVELGADAQSRSPDFGA